jgi:transcriptional regulator with XRE-family HTH domain
VKITGAQIRAARAFLKWSSEDLAEAADVGDSTVRSIEKDVSIKGGGMENTLDYRIAVRAEALAKIVKAMETAGITFLPANAQGVGLRGKVG